MIENSYKVSKWMLKKEKRGKKRKCNEEQRV